MRANPPKGAEGEARRGRGYGVGVATFRFATPPGFEMEQLIVGGTGGSRKLWLGRATKVAATPLRRRDHSIANLNTPHDAIIAAIDSSVATRDAILSRAR